MIEEKQALDTSLAEGDHVCGFYYGADQRDALLLPFLRQGLRNGDKCCAIVDSTEPSAVAAKVADDNIDVATCLASGQLQLWTSEDTYLKNGSFSLDGMITFWRDNYLHAVMEGTYSTLRAAGEMCWLARVEMNREVIVDYETWAHDYAPQNKQILLCLYDISEVGGGILMDLLRTHPKLMVGGLVVENPHYLSAREFGGTLP